jgi:hypothetical protein
MHALSVHLSAKRLYIADLATRIESMESGRTAMNAIAYRLYVRRMQSAMSSYPLGLLAAQLGRLHPAVMQAVEQRQFETEGVLGGLRGRKAELVATALLRHLRSHRRRARP